MAGCHWASSSLSGKAYEETLMIPEAVSILQSTLLLMADTSQHHVSFRRKQICILQHLNQQLKSLVKE